MSNKASDLRNVPVASIEVNPVALRDVDKDDLQYQSLRDSVRKNGILNPITVREKYKPDGSTYFEVLDGLQRYSAAADNEFETMPVNVLSVSDAEVIENQIVANICKVDTKPAQYADALKRMMLANPTMTVADLADKVSQSMSWINQRFGLLRLAPEIQTLVDDGSINVSNAYTLSKLDKTEQMNFLDQAMQLPTPEFTNNVNNRLKELRAAARAGKPAGEPTFVATSHIRKKPELEAEYTAPSIGLAIVAARGLTTAAAGFNAGIEWVLSLDADSVATAKQKWETRRAELEDAKKRREAERAAAKAEEATAKAEAAKAAAGVK